MKDNEMSIYNIDREDPGLELLKNKPEIIDWLWQSRIYRFYETGSPEQKYLGADFILENGKLIDLKCNIGEYKPGRYYDKIVLSVYRYNIYKQEWTEVLLDKKTDYWFFPIQINSNTIQFYVISRKQAEILKNKYEISKPRETGGSLNRYMIIDLDDKDISKAKFQYLIREDKFIRSDFKLH